jgi:hypothetical protein
MRRDFAPTDPTNWDPVPQDVDAALDQLADRELSSPAPDIGPMVTAYASGAGPTLSATEATVGTVTIAVPTTTSKVQIIARVNVLKDTGTAVRTSTVRVRRGSLNTDPQVGRDSDLRSQGVASSPFGPGVVVAEDVPGVAGNVTYTVRALASASCTTPHYEIQAVVLEGAQGPTGPAGPGLSHFTDGRSTAAPNATVPAHSLVASGAEEDIDGVGGAPKGTGAFLLQTPDNTTAGGNKRGLHAVDLQTFRTAATQVASGSYSVVMTRFATASGVASVAMGSLSTASGQSSVTMNDSTVATATAATATGSSTSAVGPQALSGGRRANANRVSMHARSTGRQVVSGDCQWGQCILLATTTSATPVEMSVSDAAATQFYLWSNQLVGFRARVVARRSGGSESALFERRGLIGRTATLGSIVLLGLQTVGSDIGSNSGDPPAGWGVTFEADTTLGGLKITVTTGAEISVAWHCDIDFGEIIY